VHSLSNPLSFLHFNPTHANQESSWDSVFALWVFCARVACLSWVFALFHSSRACLRIFSRHYLRNGRAYACLSVWRGCRLSWVSSICNGCIAAKRCGIWPRLLLITNKKSHIEFKMTWKSLTLNDYKGSYRTIVCQSCGILFKRWVVRGRRWYHRHGAGDFICTINSNHIFIIIYLQRFGRNF